MIIYDLLCQNHHRFEGWFKNSEDYQHQKASGLLACPVCDTCAVEKVPSASHVQTRAARDAADERSQSSAEVLAKLQRYLERHCEDVGTQFAEKARRIHYGEEEWRGIRGVATPKQARELVEEGIEIIALPSTAINKSNLN
ncbi:MAG: DUF1178 family protein [Pseudomonadota bacterium]